MTICSFYLMFGSVKIAEPVTVMKRVSKRTRENSLLLLDTSEIWKTGQPWSFIGLRPLQRGSIGVRGNGRWHSTHGAIPVVRRWVECRRCFAGVFLAGVTFEMEKKRKAGWVSGPQQPRKYIPNKHGQPFGNHH